MIVTAKQNVLIQLDTNSNVPTIVTSLDDSKNVMAGLLVTHDDGSQFLDFIPSVNMSPGLILTYVNHWWYIGGVWMEKTQEKMIAENAIYPSYMQSQFWDIWTTRDKILKVVSGVPVFIDSNSAEFATAIIDSVVQSGYYRAYDYFLMESCLVPVIQLQWGQLSARYPAVGSGYITT